MRTPTLKLSAYLSTTWQDWQFGPGFYLGTHLELSLYVGPFSFNLCAEIEPKQVQFLIPSDIHFDDFRGKAEYLGDVMDTMRYSDYGRHGNGKRLFDPFTKKPFFKVYRSPSKGAKW